MGIFASAKDRIVEQTALSYLNNSLLAPYGHATNLRVDSTAKTLSIEVELKGEVAPVRIEILDYDLAKQEDRYFISAAEIRTSREWLTRVAKDFLVKRRFELPSETGAMLMRAL